MTTTSQNVHLLITRKLKMSREYRKKSPSSYLCCHEKVVLVFGDDSVTGNIPVFVRGNRVQKVPGVSQSISSDWSQVGKLKVAIENFTNVAAAWSTNSNTEPDT